MTLEDCLPPDLRGPATTITRIAAGLSGAGVYRVEAAGKSFVLKIAAESENPADWRRGFHVQRLAADAGLAPRIVHADEARRAVLSAFVADRSFLAFYMDPRTHEAALTQLGRTVRRLHELPPPVDARPIDPREFLVHTWTALQTGFSLPDFVRDAVQRVLAEEPPADGRTPVLGHNDLNPTNLVYDGENILILDWATAGLMHPFYDLAAISVFLRMDEGTCRSLLAAHDGEPVDTLPARFAYTRRLVAVFCGSTLLNLARQMKHPGASGAETLASTLSLAEFYQRLRTGALNLATAEGQWAFGLALLKESLAL
ncbi:phosphotransferase [Archangium sp.]|jgi:aminoglycoside phosphotransferase (APT) family kinase protein|uniref:phosphotransferase n=1 Tax=Archangium sp. TaxID=1872627 RepID=UPI002ED7B27F